jgi:Flavoprotein
MTSRSINPADTTPNRPVLYLIGCAAAPLPHIPDAITYAQGRGYDTCLILTPTAATWLEDDLPELEQITGHPVRSTYKKPGTKDVLPDPDAFLVAPMTLATTTMWADGHQTTLALGLITEAAGRKIHDTAVSLPTQPIVAMPYLNAWQAAHPAFEPAVERLRKAGVDVLLGQDGVTPHVPHTGQGKPSEFPWHRAVDALDRQRR